MSIQKVRAYFETLGIADRIREFDVSSATVELAAVAVGVEGARIAKSLSFKVDDHPIIIVVAGDAKVDNSRYKAQFHTKAKMLTHEEAHTLRPRRGRRVPLRSARGREGVSGCVLEAVRDGVPRRRQRQQRRGDDLRRAGAVRLQLPGVGGRVQGLAAGGAGLTPEEVDPC